MMITDNQLLIIDGIVNLLLGMLLVSYPLGLAGILGVPETTSAFYPTILGAVLIGIGVALLIDVYGAPHGLRGLGLAGAIIINFCGAGMLIIWLICAALDLPLRGYIILWSIAIAVLAIGFVELLTRARHR